MVDSSRGQQQSATPPVRPTPAVVAAPRARRRRRPLVLAVAVGVLWFVGQGLGWLGSGLSPEQGDGDGLGRGVNQAGAASDRSLRAPEAATSKPSPQVVGPVDAVQPAKGAVVDGASDGETQVAAGTQSTGAVHGGGGESSRADGDEGLPQRQAESGVSDDRFASLVSLFESHLSADELGSAAASLQRVMKQPLSGAQRDRITALEARLLPLRRACEMRILAFVQSGDVLAADRQAAQLVVGGVWQAAELLAAVPKLAVADNWQRLVGAKRASAPLPKLLQRNRRVRIRFGDQLRLGTVASSSRDEVVVRLVSGGGQIFPSVKAVSCEPMDSTVGEAVEMGLAAVQAGSPRLARLWLLRAYLLSDELTTRGNQLLDLLR